MKKQLCMVLLAGSMGMNAHESAFSCARISRCLQTARDQVVDTYNYYVTPKQTQKTTSKVKKALACTQSFAAAQLKKIKQISISSAHQAEHWYKNPRDLKDTAAKGLAVGYGAVKNAVCSSYKYVCAWRVKQSAQEQVEDDLKQKWAKLKGIFG